MHYFEMKEADIDRVIPLYMDYYNTCEEGVWTRDTTYKRIHQVWSREDSLCILAQRDGAVVGFAMGYFEQYDDLKAYDLVEIVIAREYQGRGLGSALMEELEARVREKGGASIQLQAVNDEQHERFYGRLGYGNAINFVLKTKWL